MNTPMTCKKTSLDKQKKYDMMLLTALHQQSGSVGQHTVCSAEGRGEGGIRTGLNLG